MIHRTHSPENATYTLSAYGDGTFAVTGGWFVAEHQEPARVRAVGCTWGIDRKALVLQPLRWSLAQSSARSNTSSSAPATASSCCDFSRANGPCTNRRLSMART